jgi:deoxycytidine triphosphate deaminase
MINSQQILEENLILESKFGKPAQVGYDLSLKAVNKVTSKILGKVFIDTTYSPKEKHVAIELSEVDGKEGWLLDAGVYDFVMNEGCNIAANRLAFIKQRSSLARNGTLMQSSLFDPGFKTESIGSLGFVFLPIFIEKNARVAQMYFHECNSVSEDQLYNGQFQGDKQRK